MSKKYYKVTTSSRTSVWAPWQLSVKYNFGEWTKPNTKEFPLAVFDSLEAAIDFASGESLWRIFECEIKGKRKTTWLLSKSCILSTSLFDLVLKKIDKHEKFLDLVRTDLPPGTVTCNAVKITEEVFKNRERW